MRMNKKNKRRMISALQVTLIFLVTFGIAGYFSFLGVDPHHDGIMLKPASDIIHGRMLFRDTFTQYGAFTTILQSWALLIFGNYLVVLKLLTAFFYGLIAVMLWFIWRLFISEALATLACIILIFLSPFHEPNLVFFTWSSVYSLFFQLVTLYSLLRFFKTEKLRWQIIAGSAAALTFWCRQPVGIMLFGSIVFYLLFLKFRKFKVPYIKPFFIFYVLVHDAFFIWIIANKALAEWFYQTIRFPGIWVTSASHNPIVLFMNFVGNMFPNSYSPLSIWTLMPLLALYLGFTYVMKRRLSKGDILPLLFICITLGSWLQYHPVGDTHHQWWALSPMIGFALYAALNLGADNRKKIIYLLICLLLFAPDMVYHVRLARRKIRNYWAYPTVTKPEVLRGMKVPPEEKRFYEEAMDKLTEYKKIHPDSFVITNIDQALYPLFDGKNINCYNITVNWDWKSYDPKLEKIYSRAMKRCIEEYKPAIFTHRSQVIPDGYVRATKRESLWNVFLIVPKSQ